MPVISSNALVKVLDSYSCVGIVSDSTLISIPLKGAAALMNHSSSFSCCSLLKVEGWNSRSTHRFASSMPAKALPLINITASAALIVSRPLMDAPPPKGLPETSVNAMIEAKRMSIENVFAHILPQTGHISQQCENLPPMAGPRSCRRGHYHCVGATNEISARPTQRHTRCIF